jgi:hypothetical protein
MLGRILARISARMLAWGLLAGLLSGCVSDGGSADFATTSQKLGPPRAGQGRVVLLRESSIRLGSFDVKLDGTPIHGLKSGTYVYADVAAGTHQLTADEIMFPGTTQQEIAVQSGRTYYFMVKTSQKSDAITAMSLVGGLAGFAVGAMATSKSDNPGPLDFVAMDAPAATTALAGLKLGS